MVSVAVGFEALTPTAAQAANSVHSQRFWRVIESFTEEQKSAVVMFSWGRSHLPDRSEEWSFGIYAIRTSYNDDFHLPFAHTCFNHIEIPAYSSDAIMRNKLLVAITMGTDISEQ